MDSNETTYRNDRGETLTEDEFVAWCEREEAARMVRHLGYVPLPADDE